MDMSRKILTALVAAITFSSASFAANVSQEDYDAIAERIKPVGDVYLAGSEPVKAEPTGPRDGATVYGTFCIACHASGVSGAPKTGDAGDWGPRIAQGKDVLKDHAINGFNAMPAKGSCMDCSDDEIVAAIEHMIAGL
ncbi:cytochrome c5 family protein [Vibrio sp. Isolate25]|uniref:c-type cytochrome n=1 Tax=Vibrio TaxID=662 RepID=UPI001EFC5C2B|nr:MULTISPECIES: cytochrome c5 family protein [Vibrio]MCG9598979.1 cytochrome c5 family protein [Vibrio sp. Isolate25]MCG9680250.1 cytochrome c5 family protein [Vibrio sp. Isolate24]MCG9684771.1 cytochrome c5 family protein [Vibrio sp. Isolate23]USD34113.1 cytochrome c5 family protein [Vibrio sp. SCSIO 43186]USD47186.1 cytochrome c5 family protein [Vibrio sp. SCSIO 43145]